MATRHLRNIIGSEPVKCRMHKMDRYGRYLMTCHKPDGTDIHAQMVRYGYATVSTFDPDKYLSAENDARENNRGLWRGLFRHPYCFRHQKRQDWTIRAMCDNEKYYMGWDTERYNTPK